METESRQVRRWRERQFGAVKGSTSPHPPNQGETRSLRAWHISVGIPTAFVAIGIGLAVSGGSYFWPGVGLAYAGCIWLLFDWWFFSKDLSNRVRLVGTIGTCIILIVISWVAFRPAPLTIVFVSQDVSYIDGDAIYGIKWKDSYYPSKLLVVNESSDTYIDVEIMLRTDMFINEMGQPKGTGCTFHVATPGLTLSTPDMQMYKEGKLVARPVDIKAGYVYSIYCEKVLSHDSMEFIAALIPPPFGNNPPPGADKPLPGDDRRRPPKWVIVDINYISSGRPEHRMLRKCMDDNKTCPKIPESISSGVLVVSGEVRF
jgi:hypothetical protein